MDENNEWDMFPANHLEIVLATLAHMSQWLFVVTFSFERPNILLSVVLFNRVFLTLKQEICFLLQPVG